MGIGIPSSRMFLTPAKAGVINRPPLGAGAEEGELGAGPVASSGAAPAAVLLAKSLRCAQMGVLSGCTTSTTLFRFQSLSPYRPFLLPSDPARTALQRPTPAPSKFACTGGEPDGRKGMEGGPVQGG